MALALPGKCDGFHFSVMESSKWRLADFRNRFSNLIQSTASIPIADQTCRAPSSAVRYVFMVVVSDILPLAVYARSTVTRK